MKIKWLLKSKAIKTSHLEKKKSYILGKGSEDCFKPPSHILDLIFNKIGYWLRRGIKEKKKEAVILL